MTTDAGAAPAAPSFAALGISAALVRALRMLAITVPTPIQAACIPGILDGRDVIGGAQTGSGKTLAFALPILHKLVRDMVGGYAVVLTPTRELAVQLHEQFLAVGQGARMGLRCALVIGGVDQLKQANELAEQRPHVIVATPGRLVDLLSSGATQEWGLERCQFLVLDEADRLLSPTFAEPLAYLLSVLPAPAKRQTLLFTATLTPEIERLTQKKTAPGQRPPLLRKIEMEYMYALVPSHMREPYLVQLLASPPGHVAPKPVEDDASQVYRRGGRTPTSKAAPKDDTPVWPRAIIFVSRGNTAELVSRMLTELGVPNVSLHAALPQKRRLEHLQTFRAQRVPILVATDVASRGLDVPDVELVVNYDVPAAWEDYVHRVGRTARRGRRGWAVSMVTEHDVALVQSIEEKLQTKWAELEIADAPVLERLSSVSAAKRVASMALHDEKFGEQREQHKRKARAARGAPSKRQARDT